MNVELVVHNVTGRLQKVNISAKVVNRLCRELHGSTLASTEETKITHKFRKRNPQPEETAFKFLG